RAGAEPPARAGRGAAAEDLTGTGRTGAGDGVETDGIIGWTAVISDLQGVLNPCDCVRNFLQNCFQNTARH
ncbi:hypothetical protein, partial [Streptomyces oceani]|uniref:hypothetical protein n=1 Tax=Streptomyces oceani TaxID=1075402 RepID=UPI001BAFDB13